jgi:hypothetical protein
MGKFINIGNTDFASVRDEYVDKSQLIAYVTHVLGTQRMFLNVTRARRFGKSLAALSLKYHMDSDEMQIWYDGSQIGTMAEIYNPYSVIKRLFSITSSSVNSQQVKALPIL